MAVPSFQSMMLPFLKFIADGNEYRNSTVREHIARHFGLTDEEKNEQVPSGSTTRLSNRIGWCRTHLKHAKLIQYVRPGVYQITERGKDLLGGNPTSIHLRDLDRFEEHRSWFHRKPAAKQEDSATDVSEESSTSNTPEEVIAAARDDLAESLKADLLDQLSRVDPYRFEQIVLDVLVAMGYGGSREEAARRTKSSNDEGIDGVINEDRLGLDVVYVQAKRWQGAVGRREIQAFVGALAGQQATKGIFISTSTFNSNAIDYALRVTQRVILIDGRRLADLMIEHNVGVSVVRTIAIKRLDTDYFGEE